MPQIRAVQSGFGTRGMGALVQRVRREGLTVDELFAGRDDNLVFGRGVESPVAPHLADWAEEQVIVDHLVDSRMTLEVALMLDLPSGLGLELLKHLRATHFQIGLGSDIEHIEDLQFREDLVFGLLLPG